MSTSFPDPWEEKGGLVNAIPYPLGDVVLFQLGASGGFTTGEMSGI